MTAVPKKSGPAKMVASVIEQVLKSLVGRRDEVSLALAVLESGRSLFLEGPPGTSKSTMLRAIVEELGRPFHWIAGTSDVTAGKLIGYFDPAMALSHGYRPEFFEHGPLTKAMLDGGVLYVEEFNRLPDDTCNAFIAAMSERALPVPRLGTITAKPSFCVVASMNPLDDAGTSAMSRALRDRFCSIRMNYQTSDEERAIVHRNIAEQARVIGLNIDLIVDVAVDMCRRTRGHKNLTMGASVRGAIDMAAVSIQLLSPEGPASAPENSWSMLRLAASCALRDKVRVNEACERSVDELIDEIWARQLSDTQVANRTIWSPEALEKKKAAVTQGTPC